jgi:histidyl-tRNA synthetase
VFPAPAGAVEVFVVDAVDGDSAGATALQLCHDLRQAGIGADRAFEGRSIKAQMRLADRSGARLGLIVGNDEFAAGEVTVKELRAGGDQVRVKLTAAVEAVRAKLAGP